MLSVCLWSRGKPRVKFEFESESLTFGMVMAGSRALHALVISRLFHMSFMIEDSVIGRLPEEVVVSVAYSPVILHEPRR
jgi:hypothetical protein